MAVTNAKLYVDRAEGFFGIGKSMKDAEFVCDCSDIDDVIVFTKDGRYVITKVSDKAFFDKNIYYIGVFSATTTARSTTFSTATGRTVRL